MLRIVISLAIGFIVGTTYGVFFAVEVPDGLIIKGVQIIKAFLQ